MNTLHAVSDAWADPHVPTDDLEHLAAGHGLEQTRARELRARLMAWGYAPADALELMVHAMTAGRKARNKGVAS